MNFNPNKLKVNFINSDIINSQINYRKYTLRYDFDLNNSFLDIANFYNYNKIDFTLRNEVLGEWILINKNKYTLCLYIYLKGYFPYEIKLKYEMFKAYLPNIIKSILYGDKNFIYINDFLLNSEIIVNFNSDSFMFNTSENYKKVKSYFIN